MLAMTTKFPAKFSVWKRKLSFSVLTLVFCASSAWAAAPSVVVDAQLGLGSGYNNPQSIATNGTNQRAIFIADTNNNQIVELVNGNSTAGNGGIALVTPQALALDSKGNLFIGDTPSSNGTTYGRISEFLADANGNLNGTSKVVFSGAPLTNPISLVVDSAGTLFIGDYPPSGLGVIYTLASGGTTPQLLNITGLPSEVTPAALVRDNSGNLFIADNGNFVGGDGGVYVAPAAGGAAQPLPTESFVLDQPTGLAMDPAGDLYILTQLGTGSGYNAGSQVLVLPASSPTTPYILPNVGIGISSSLALDPLGNVDVLDLVDGAAVQLTTNAVNMGSVAVGQAGTQIQFNFELNAPTYFGGFRIVTQGDNSTELAQSSGGSCILGQQNNLPGGGPPISAYYPYTCYESYQGEPAYPGIRSSAILVKGSGSNILDSIPAYELGLAGAEVTYPLSATNTVANLQTPQAIAISGLNNLVYIADTQAGEVYSVSGLSGSTPTLVSTGSITLQAPSALALDGEGNLFIADFNLGEVIEVPTATGQAPSVVNTGGLLQHPIALAFDYLGNLYIGDSSSGGQAASNSNPGYLVKLPVGGTPFILPTPGVEVVFPQALATDPYGSLLVVGDGGDPSGVGKVVYVLTNGTAAGTGPINGVTDPTGVAFDAAQSLYVLDGAANTITVVPISGATPYPLGFDNSSLSAASALGISAGGQSFIISNIGQGSKNGLLFLNGNSAKLAFGNVNVGSQSQSMTATVYNIGNETFSLSSPFYTTNGSNPAFSILGSTTCSAGDALAFGGSCTINAQFTPSSLGTTSEQLTIQSNAYNPGGTLTLQGTGTSGGAVHKKKH